MWGRGAGVCPGSPVRCLTLPLCPDTGLIVKTQGNATHNTVCQCRAGMHCSDTSCQTCVENQPCKQGFGFVAGETQKLPLSPQGPRYCQHQPQVLPSMGCFPGTGLPAELRGSCAAAVPGGIATGEAAQ